MKLVRQIYSHKYRMDIRSIINLLEARFSANVHIRGKVIEVGRFATYDEAAEAADHEARVRKGVTAIQVKDVADDEPEPESVPISSSRWPEHLNDEDIARYIEQWAGDDVDWDILQDHFRGAEATLKLIPIDQISEGNADANIRSASKEKRYAKMDAAGMPPIVVQDGVVVDGNHRYRIAKARGQKDILCYVVEFGLDEGAFDSENTYEYGTTKEAAQYASHAWYHGTEEDFDAFKLGVRRMGTGESLWFAENPKLTGYYGPNQYKVMLHFKNPLIVSEEEYIAGKPHGPLSWAKQAKAAGHDAVIIQDVIDGDTESTICCVFDPSLVQIVGKDLYVDESVQLDELFDSNRGSINWFGATKALFEVDNLTYVADFEYMDDGAYQFSFRSQREKNIRAAHGNTNDAGSKAIRVFACVVEILLTFLSKRAPDSVKFMGDNDLGKGALYKRMAKYLYPRAKALGYDVDIFDDEDESSEKDMSSFYIVKTDLNESAPRLPLASQTIPRVRGLYAALMCVMDPSDFIRLTTPADEVHQVYKDKFALSISDYDSGAHEDFNKNQYGMPFLFVEHETGKVKGHEGRHRAAMVAKEGGKRFPCAIIFKTSPVYEVTWSQEPYEVTDDNQIEYGNPSKHQEIFNSVEEADNFHDKLKALNSDFEHGIFYTRIESNRLGGSTMKGSPRSDTGNWSYDAWQPSDMPPQLIGQYDNLVVVPSSRMKIGVVKGYGHYK